VSEYLLGAIVLVGIGVTIWVASMSKGKAIAERDRDDLVDEAERRKRAEGIDAKRDKDHRTGNIARLRERIARVLRTRSERDSKPPPKDDIPT